MPCLCSAPATSVSAVYVQPLAFGLPFNSNTFMSCASKLEYIKYIILENRGKCNQKNENPSTNSVAARILHGFYKTMVSDLTRSHYDKYR